MSDYTELRRLAERVESNPLGLRQRQQFVDAASPSVTLALLDELDRYREALSDLLFWIDVECEHPRRDPHPAMAMQAQQARAALLPERKEGEE